MSNKKRLAEKTEADIHAAARLLCAQLTDVITRAEAMRADAERGSASSMSNLSALAAAAERTVVKLATLKDCAVDIEDML